MRALSRAGDNGRVVIEFAAELRLFLTARHRGDGRVEQAVNGSLGHLVEAAGVPLTEVGPLVRDGETVPPSYRPTAISP